MQRLVTYLIMLLLAVPCYAGSIIVNAESAITTPVVGATIATRNGTGHRYKVVDYADSGSDQCITWHLMLPDDYAATTALSARLNFQARGGTGSQAAEFRFEAECVDNTEDFLVGPTANGDTFSFDAGDFTDDDVHQEAPGAAGIIDESTCSPLDSMIMQLCRVGGDVFGGTVSLLSIQLSYTGT